MSSDDWNDSLSGMSGSGGGHLHHHSGGSPRDMDAGAFYVFYVYVVN
jgi:hypothetical protein